MLKRFILNTLSSFVGAWLAIVICFIGLILLCIGIVGSIFKNDSEKLTRHSILKISLSGPIEESESKPQFDINMLVSGDWEMPQTLKILTAAIKEARSNKNIDAIYINCGGVAASPATLDALRKEIISFKSSGKRVFAYGDVLTMGDYFVASAADEVYLNPAGSLDLQGITGTSLYYKDLLDKIGVDIQAVRVGTFKSAIEPYTSNKMSEPAKMQLDTLYNQMWGYILDELAQSRDVKPSTINNEVNGFIFLKEASVAKNLRLVDDCIYEREMMDKLAKYVGEETKNLNFVSPSVTVGSSMIMNPGSNDQIAVLYAVGDIAEYNGAGINCAELVPLIVKFAEEDNIKGMVLRVNSPGGSVFGSEQIGEALDYFKSKGKPLAVSMGDYAASGGYWISAGADFIFANPLTITGSIGIFGLVPNIGKLADKIGITPQTVSTNPGVRFPSIFYPMNNTQEAALQENIERGYDKFITRVAQGRHKTKDYIKSIAEGRVWSGMEAQKLGLVDELGGLQNAIDWVANKGNIKNPNVVSYPMPDESMLSLLQTTTIAQSPEIQLIIDHLGHEGLEQKIIKFAEWLLLQNPLQARSPQYIFSF